MKKNKDQILQNRLEIIASSNKIGLRQTEKIYGVTKKTIIGWKKKLNEFGEEGLANKSRIDQNFPNRISDEIKNQIVELKRSNPSITPETIIENLGIEVSVSTVKKIINNNNPNIKLLNEDIVQSIDQWQINAIKTDIYLQNNPVFILAAINIYTKTLLLSITFENIPLNLKNFIRHVADIIRENSKAKIHFEIGRGRFINDKNSGLREIEILLDSSDIILSKQPKPFLSEISRFISCLSKAHFDEKQLVSEIESKLFYYNLEQTRVIDSKSTIYFLNSYISIFNCKNIINFGKTHAIAEVAELLYKRVIYLLEDGEISITEKVVHVLNELVFLSQDCTLKVKSYLAAGKLESAKNHFSGNNIFFQNAKELAEKCGLTDLKIESIITITALQIGREPLTVSEKSLKAALSDAIKNKNIHLESGAAGNLGLVYMIKNNLTAAKFYFKIQMDAAIENNDKSLFCKALNNFTCIYRKEGYLEKSLFIASKGLVWAERQRDFYIKFNTYNQIAMSYQVMQKYDDAEYYYKKALEIAKEKNHKSNVAEALTSLGNIECQRKNFYGSIKLIEKGIALAKQAEDLYIEEFCYASLGQVYAYLNKIRTALYFYNKSLKICFELKNFDHIAVIYGKISECYINTGKHDKAFEYAKKKYELVKFSGNNMQIINAMARISRSLAQVKKYGEAIECYKEQLKLLSGSDNFIQKGLTIANIGNCLSEMKEYNDASEYFSKALKILKSINNHHFVAKIYLKLAEIQIQNNQTKKAMSLLKHSKCHAELANDKVIFDEIRNFENEMNSNVQVP